MRLQHPVRLWDLHLAHQLEAARSGRGGISAHLVVQQHLDQLRPDGERRVQPVARVLEDDRDARAAEVAHRLRSEAHEIGISKPHVPADDAARLGDQAHDRQPRHRLAGSGFAQQRQHAFRV